MISVCPECGMFEARRDVEDVPFGLGGVAVCRDCGARIPFRRRPLHVVTGASGTGKTTACHALALRKTGYLVLESDILWGAVPVESDQDIDAYWNVWLRLVRNINQGDQEVILFGTVEPPRIERQPERRYLGPIRYLALVTDPNEHRTRLLARPGWRQSSDPSFINTHIKFNQWFIDNADSGSLEWSTYNTTKRSVEDTAHHILTWLT